MKKQNVGDLITEESKRFNKFVYSSKPYPCGIEEARMSYKDIEVNFDNVSIIRYTDKTEIFIKPEKGTGKRKPFKISLWVS